MGALAAVRFCVTAAGLVIAQPAPGAGRQRIDPDPAEVAACERLDPVADGRDHALDLVVLAFDQGEPQRAGPGRLAGGGAHRLVLVVQQHALQQPLDLRRVDRMLATHLVDLGHVMLRRRQAMDQRAVVGEEQHAGRVLVEPADRLHTALAQGRGQQRIDARMVLWLLRAFVPRRLVHDQERALMVSPRLAADGKVQAERLDLAVGLAADDALDRHPLGGDQAGAFAPRAEALGEQQLRQLHRRPVRR